MTSSSQPFASSPSNSQPTSTRRRKSRFIFKHLSQLSLSSTQCPLRVVSHIDLDAFYAQCEMVRLGVPEDQPLAVQQWQGLIAINYPARRYGLSRHVTITEAQKVCPEIIIQHVATWKEGEERWAYHDDAFKQMATHKVSLDPYRLQSRRILALIKEVLPASTQRVEKASVDEVFCDLSTQVHAIMLDRYPELAGPAPYDDLTENLPAPPTTALDWNADALVDLDDGQREEDDPDWDDVAMLIGSEIIRDVRAAIRERLKYTCSAGVARNKMLAKLGSAHKKPNQQTIVRNRAVQQFLSEFKFTKIRNLGGKLGDEVVAMFNTDAVKELLDVPIEQLKKLGDDTGSWLYQIIRGEDHSEVNPRTQIKSMLSAKSFRPSINTHEQAVRWMRIFSADIYLRLVEEGVVENKRRPKTINLHHRQGAQMRSKQAPIPQGKTITEDILFDLARNLLAQVIVDGRAWPCANLSLSVGGFEDGPTGNKGIGGFLVRGDEAKAVQQASAQERQDSEQPNGRSSEPPAKRRRVDDARINHFFARHEDSVGTDGDVADFDDIPSAQREDSSPQILYNRLSPRPTTSDPVSDVAAGGSSPPPDKDREKPPDQRPTTFTCSRCQRRLLLDQQEEHGDWHFAQSLQQEEQQKPPSVVQERTPQPPPSKHKPPKGRGRPPSSGVHAGGGVEKGQRKLAFGQ